jgi:fibronectin type 3 domain-containing protein
MNTRLICFGLLFLAAVSLHGQTNDGRTLALEGVYDHGVVLLRWVTGSPVVWDLLRREGVPLTRQESREKDPGLVPGAPLRVWSEEQWQAAAKKEAAAAQVLGLLREVGKEHKDLSDYAKADLEQNTLTSLALLAEFNFDVAQGLALAYKDAKVDTGKVYRYVIEIRDPVHGDTLTAECYVNTSMQLPLIPVTGVKATEGDGYIDLSWDRVGLHSGFFVERREAGAGEWKRLNIAPRLYASNFKEVKLYRDSVANNRRYEYRVLGTDGFGRVSEPSDVVSVSGRDLTPPAPPGNVQWKKKDKGVMITWTPPRRVPDLAGYVMLRSKNPDQDYEPIHKELLAPTVTSYYDVLPKSGTYFYRLVSSDTAGNLSPMSVRAMAVVDDTIAASAPTGLIASADTNGIIHLRWKHVREEDVAGYRLYRMIKGGKNPEFVPLTGVVQTDTVYHDTLQVNVRDRFTYRVRSVDFAGNYSVPSAAVGISLPDRLPPVPPVFQDYSVKDRLVHLRYVSASKDVARYEIRRTLLASNIIERKITTKTTSWTDSSARHGNEYRYEVLAIDSAGNVSEPSKAVMIKPFWKVELKTPAAPIVALHPKMKKAVTVSWQYPEAQSYSAIVFRKKDDGAYFQLSPLLTASNFTDSSAAGPARYEYALRFYVREQGGTEMSAPAKIAVP